MDNSNRKALTKSILVCYKKRTFIYHTRDACKEKEPCDQQIDKRGQMMTKEKGIREIKLTCLHRELPESRIV